jgi:hypothetical protein
LVSAGSWEAIASLTLSARAGMSFREIAEHRIENTRIEPDGVAILTRQRARGPKVTFETPVAPLGCEICPAVAIRRIMELRASQGITQGSLMRSRTGKPLTEHGLLHRIQGMIRRVGIKDLRVDGLRTRDSLPLLRALRSLTIAECLPAPTAQTELELTVPRGDGTVIKGAGNTKR